MPIGLAVGGANTHDQKLLDETLDSIPIRRPKRSGRRRHLCLDKGYDCEAIRQRVRRRGYVPHIRSRGEEQSEKQMQGKRARRWVVERVASWLNRYRRQIPLLDALLQEMDRQDGAYGWFESNVKGLRLAVAAL